VLSILEVAKVLEEVQELQLSKCSFGLWLKRDVPVTAFTNTSDFFLFVNLQVFSSVFNHLVGKLEK